jgi:hypothetical protein
LLFPLFIVMPLTGIMIYPCHHSKPGASCKYFHNRPARFKLHIVANIEKRTFGHGGKIGLNLILEAGRDKSTSAA